MTIRRIKISCYNCSVSNKYFTRPRIARGLFYLEKCAHALTSQRHYALTDGMGITTNRLCAHRKRPFGPGFICSGFPF